MNIVLIGAPGSGKGTQCALLQKELGLTHISSGDLFRYNLKNNTPLGEEAQKYMDAGELVPDDITVNMVKERLQRPDVTNGALLDGFPRTIPQATALAAMLAEMGQQVDGVLHMDVPQATLITRLTGRLICRECGSVFHKTFNPFKTCPVSKCENGEYLYQREDDKIEVVQTRLDTYFRQTAPLLDFYRAQGVLTVVDADKGMRDVTTEMMAAVAALDT